ncbi:unnamed protein product [Prunus armeniaca]|uniref:Uncharacterized protein n=1 Tax=Prunus armeniaca TaxID=36596 RepID=A0A6J5TVZ7_PRUAR|nr:unnamed protein product [Prunus armeniaca]
MPSSRFHAPKYSSRLTSSPYLALDTKLTQNIPIEYLAKKSIDMADCISMVVDEALTWMTSLWAFLTNDALPH